MYLPISGIHHHHNTDRGVGVTACVIPSPPYAHRRKAGLNKRIDYESVYISDAFVSMGIKEDSESSSSTEQ